MTHSEENIGEQALNKAIEVGLSEQLKQVDYLDVDVQTNPLKLVQGEVDSVTVDGRGVITQKDIRFERIVVTTDQLEINLIKTILGSFELEYLENANVQIVLTEEDLNRALNSQYVVEQLHNFAIPIGQESLYLDWQSGSISLPGEGLFYLEGKSVVERKLEKKMISFETCFRILEGGQSVSLVSGKYKDNTDLPLDITASFLSQIIELVNTKKLNIKNLEVVIKEISVAYQAVKIQFSLDSKT